MGRKEERIATAEHSGPNFMRDGPIVSTDNTALTSSERVQSIWAASLFKVVVELLEERTMQIFMALLREAALEGGRNVQNTDVRLTVLKSNT